MVPVPVTGTVCGLPGALSVRVSSALRVFFALGVNDTLMVQLLPANSEVPQVLVCVKSPVLVPVKLMLVMERVAVPVLLSVTFCDRLVVPRTWVAKVRLDGD